MHTASQKEEGSIYSLSSSAILGRYLPMFNQTIAMGACDTREVFCTVIHLL